jgi:hypothetical protein
MMLKWRRHAGYARCMPPVYDEDLVDAAVFMIGTLATRSAPDEPRIQLEVILMGAVSHAVHQLGMPCSEAYRSLSWLLDELKAKSADPSRPPLTLVP